LIYALAWLLHGLAVLVSCFNSLKGEKPWTPFLTPFKVALAGTHHYYSSQKAQKAFGYRPLVTVREGIDLTLKTKREKKEE
jgi:sterol-4alpha-carboxylate 3-dehydrogenase (decarboxylating)